MISYSILISFGSGNDLVQDRYQAIPWLTSRHHCESEEYMQVKFPRTHYSDVIMSVVASQITGVSVVYSAVCSGADQRKHQSSTSLTFVRGIPRPKVSNTETSSWIWCYIINKMPLKICSPNRRYISEITNKDLSAIYLTACSGWREINYHKFFISGPLCWESTNGFPHKGPVKWKSFPNHDNAMFQ